MLRICLTLILTLLCSQVAAGSLYGDSVRLRLQDSDKDGVINGRDRCSDTPAGALVDNYGCHKENSKLLSLELNVLFDSGRHEVKPQFYGELKKLADFLRRNPEAAVVIEGHTDDVGSDILNQDLSQHRAAAIADVLVQKFRISQDRVRSIGYGEAKPIASNDTPEGRKQNRRVVAEVFAQKADTRQRWTIYSVDRDMDTAYSQR